MARGSGGVTTQEEVAALVGVGDFHKTPFTTVRDVDVAGRLARAGWVLLSRILPRGGWLFPLGFFLEPPPPPPSKWAPHHKTVGKVG